MPTILCVATYLKGEPFIRECHRAKATVLLLTADVLADAAWPRDAIAAILTIPRNAEDAVIRRAVAAAARRHPIARVVSLDDFDVEMAGMLREFLQVPGFGRTVAGRFRDKLTMRTEAKRLGLRVPPFTPAFNDIEVADWTSRVPPPWVLKPRSSAASTGIRKIAGPHELWPALEAAGDDRPYCLLEAFVAGDVCHVDSIVHNGEVVCAVASKYGRPPYEVAHQGGIFVTRRLADDSPTAVALLEANRRLLNGFELKNGVSHTEFILGPGGEDGEDGEDGVTFLETSARVGGAYIVDVVEAATGINLWHEWAKLELAGPDGEYSPPPVGTASAGIALCLARQERPDTAAYNDPEIIRRIDKHHHAGLIVRSDDYARVDALVEDYRVRFTRDFLATMPAPARPVE